MKEIFKGKNMKFASYVSYASSHLQLLLPPADFRKAVFFSGYHFFTKRDATPHADCFLFWLFSLPPYIRNHLEVARIAGDLTHRETAVCRTTLRKPGRVQMTGFFRAGRNRASPQRILAMRSSNANTSPSLPGLRPAG